MWSDRQRGGVMLTEDSGATDFEFVANKHVQKEGSDCCGEWGSGVVCVTKGNGGMCQGARGADAMMKDPRTWLGFSC